MFSAADRNRSRYLSPWTSWTGLVVQALACLVVSLAAHAAPLPEEIRQAVREVAKCDYTQPRQAAYTLEQFAPRATGDAEQRSQLAALLAQLVVAPETTPLGRTLLCQQLALVVTDAELPVLTKLLDNPATAADARIALRALRGFALGAPAPAESQDRYLAQAADAKPSVRIAALSALTRSYPDAALPVLVRALRDDTASVSATAIRRLGTLDGAKLAAELPTLTAAQQVLALGVLAEGKVTAARQKIAELAGSQNESVRLAAIATLGALGDASTVPLLAKIAADEKAAVQAAAENALSELVAPGVDEAVLKQISSGTSASRVTMINAATLRSLPGAVPSLLTAAHEQDAAVQTAAFKALAKLAEADVYPQLIELLARTQNPALEAAVAAIGRRVEAAPARVAPLVALLKRSDLPDTAQAAVLRTLALTGGAEALAAVRERLATQDAAVRALADWPDAEALDDLHRVLQQPATTATHRTLAWRGLVRLAPTSPQPMEWFTRVRPLLKTTAEKRLWLGALSELQDPAALTLAEELTADTDVAAEARLAADKINQALGGKSQYADARRAALTKTLPAGAKLVAYLDCGAEAQDRSGSVRLHTSSGKSWRYAVAGDPTAQTVAYAGGHVDFDASGLDPKKSYAIGFTWWDADDNGRAQSVWAGRQQLVEKTALPGGSQGPATLTRAIPAAAIFGGKVSIAFKQEAKSNTVACELWIIESTNPLPATTSAVPAAPLVAPPAAKQPESGPVATPLVKANTGAAKKVLIVTGLELHNWRESVPLLAAAIALDKRLEVSVVEDPRFMASPDLQRYDVFVLNYQNHQVAAPEGALVNLKKAVEGGKGLVLVHFACGAFIDWPTKTVAPEFLPIAGRVWNPKLRAHDPRGSFRVRITDAEHAITKGLADFDTEDELYTCLDGDVPVRVLATATSKVDKKDYPMAFVLTPGQGRTFHCALGHDAKAFPPTVGSLYRRGSAWAAGLEPASEK